MTVAKRLVFHGRVQGVGFRDWMVAQAALVSVSGWVRNRADNTVEALACGDAAAVDELVRQCRRGPRHAHVERIEEDVAEPDGEPGFVRRPSA